LIALPISLRQLQPLLFGNVVGVNQLRIGLGKAAAAQQQQQYHNGFHKIFYQYRYLPQVLS
jgi:hypothetical protein